MAVQKIRGNTQIMSGTITDTEINASAAIATSKLADGAEFVQRDGSVTMTGALAMGSQKITGLANGTDATDAINKGQLDSAVSGLSWKNPAKACTTQDMTAYSFGTTGVTYANGTAGVGATLTQDDATDGAFGTLDGITIVADDRVLVHNQTAGAENGVYELTTVGDGSSTPWVLTRVTDADESAELDSAAIFVQQGSTCGDIAYTQTASGATIGTTSLTFVQFTGTSVLTAGDGIDIAANVVSVDLKASAGLKIDATELAVEPADFAGTGLEDDGSDNLRLATQGNGIAGGAGTTLSVDADSETGGNIQAASVTANGVGVDINAIAGTGIEADGTANLRLAAQGNGISGGAGTTLSVDPDSETGGDTQPVSVTANGVGVDISAIAGTGLAADGSANLQVDGTVLVDGRIYTRETPSGLINGSNATYTLANTPQTGTEMVYLNGLLQAAGGSNDYTISGSTITYNTAPQTNDTLVVSYIGD